MGNRYSQPVVSPATSANRVQPLGGYVGRILEVDLSSRQMTARALDAAWIRDFVGGRGFTSWLLWERLTADTDPLGPENVLVFATAPFAGTPFPMSARIVIASRSPATGLIGDSNAGGHIAVEMKQAGFDVIVIRGQASEPVYLWLNNGRAELRDAGHLWGKGVYESDRILRQELRDQMIETALIGPAGENLVKSACVMISKLSTAGRTGIGTVMGSKKLKALAVKGHRDIRVAQPDRLLRATAEMRELLVSDPQIKQARKQGTHFLLTYFNAVGDLPTFNYRLGQFDRVDRISAEALREQGRLHRVMGCYACPTHCHRYSLITAGEYAGTYLKGPEFENAVAFGSQSGNADLDLLLYCNMLCNDLGIDTLSMGNVLSFSMECYEQGILKKADFDGLEPSWGDKETMIGLIHKTVNRLGIGDLYAEGLRSAAEEIGHGAEKLAMEVKGLEECSTDKRFDYLSGLWGFTGTRGADHLRAACSHYPQFPEKIARRLFGTEKAPDPRRIEGKGRLVKYHEDQATTADLVGVCKFFIWWSSSWENLQARIRSVQEAYVALTGIELEDGWWNAVGERVYNLERAFNVRQGLRKQDDLRVPPRYLTPMPAGPGKGRLIEMETLTALIEDYYKARGWDVETGIPTREKLTELGLGSVAQAVAALRENEP
jgi:aldehyde:ferredoxin oxidoreductase